MGFKALRLVKPAGAPADAPPQRELTELEVDQLSPGNLVIQVAYSSLNYKDALASRGRNAIIRVHPRIGGIDLVGRVVSSADPRFASGDAVIVHGFGVGVDHDGGHAALARVDADWALKLPPGLEMFEAAAIGVAGYTAALSIHLMELNGLTPQAGPVLVTGATGGVASVAIDMLDALGYRVCAMTGKSHEHDYLRAIGAADVIERAASVVEGRPLERGRWAGAIDSVGGRDLAWAIRTMQQDGVIAAFGNAGGAELQTTVLPFILRGVRLLGVNANSPMPLRNVVWGLIAQRYRPRHLMQIAQRLPLSQAPEAMDRMLAGATRGRMVIDMAL